MDTQKEEEVKEIKIDNKIKDFSPESLQLSKLLPI